MKKQAQIWVETVIYTLIGLSILAVILSIVTPKIQESKDKAVIDQSVTILDELSRDIDQIKFTAGNSWPVQIKFDKGKFVVDGVHDEIYFLFEKSQIAYSEVGEEITRGRIKIKTTKIGKDIEVRLSLSYAGVLNITSKGEDRVQTFQSASIPYDLFVENLGRTGPLTQINFNA